MPSLHITRENDPEEVADTFNFILKITTYLNTCQVGKEGAILFLKICFLDRPNYLGLQLCVSLKVRWEVLCISSDQKLIRL
jgi:hypothetical protein